MRRLSAISFCITVFPLAVQAGDVDTQCMKDLTDRLPHWKLAAPPNLVAKYALDEGRVPGRVEGDFDGLPPLDTVFLINADGVDREVPAWEARQLVFCLRSGGEMTLRIRSELYCSDEIHRWPQGEAIQDIDTDVRTTPPHDGVLAVCFHAASAVYFMDGDRIVEIVNGD